MKNREPIYQLHTIWNGEFQQTTEFIIYDSQIRAKGFFTIKTSSLVVKIYSTELAAFLCSTSFPATNQRTAEQTHINGHDYLNAFIEGYTEGIKYFEAKHGLSNDVMYSHSLTYVQTLKTKYRRTDLEGQKGWNFVIESYPLVITNSEIHKYGYYSGIVSKVHELAEEEPELFKDFFQTNEAPEPTSTPTPEDKPQKLVDLFGGDEALMNACIDVLKRLDPPQLSQQNTWIGTDKNIFVLWKNKLLRKNLMLTCTHEILAQLLNAHIEKLAISKDTFHKEPTRSKRNFDTDLDVLISKLSKVERTES